MQNAICTLDYCILDQAYSNLWKSNLWMSLKPEELLKLIETGNRKLQTY